MSYPLVIRLMLAMATDAGRLVLRGPGETGRAGRGRAVRPGMARARGKVITGWRVLVPADVMQALFLGGGRAAHRR